jgi:hypothetical protein
MMRHATSILTLTASMDLAYLYPPELFQLLVDNRLPPRTTE